MLWKFTCYFPSESPEFFVVKIDSADYIVELLDAICLELQSQRPGLKRGDLKLYKADVPLKLTDDVLQSRALEWLHIHQAEHISTREGLTTIFPTGPHNQHDKQLDILVADAELLELADGLGDPDNALNKKLKKALDASLKYLSPKASPSEVVHSVHQQAVLLGGANRHIHLGRPGGAPATIFSPALATLQARLDHLEQVEVLNPEVVRAANYIHCAAAFYENEAHRQNAIKDLIDDALGERDQVDDALGKRGEWGRVLSWADGIKPGRCWWYHEFLTMVLELKNALGLSGDALLQTVIDFSKIISKDKFKPYHGVSNFPVVFIGATANRLEISVAVCVGPIYVTKLLSLDLSLGFVGSDNVVRLARVFRVLSDCQADLKEYYNAVENFESPRLACLYPNPTTADPSLPLPRLTYKQFISGVGQPTSNLVDFGNATTAMYLATLDATKEEVIVKFTSRYNEMAHTLLAATGFAPKLHFCGQVLGGLYMVVMERVHGKSVWQLRQDKEDVPAIVSEKVREAICILHERNIVFGDLRNPNIIYDASQNRVSLVDFDWPAEDGVGKYPATLNPATTWAAEVMAYGIMRKVHDEWQLDRLAKLCKV